MAEMDSLGAGGAGGGESAPGVPKNPAESVGNASQGLRDLSEKKSDDELLAAGDAEHDGADGGESGADGDHGTVDGASGQSGTADTLGAAGTGRAPGKGHIARVMPQSGTETDGMGKVVAAGATGVAGAEAASAVMWMLQLLEWLRMLMLTAAAAIMNLTMMIVGFLVGAGKAALGALTSAGGAMSAMTGGVISSAAATATVSVAAIGVVAGTTTAVISGVAHDQAARDGVAANCGVTVQQVAQVSGTSDSGGQELQTAQTVYSVLAGWGMSNANIAGILGNWSIESGIDPTSMEGIYDEKYQIGPKKQAVTSTAGGIGLGQWTAGRNVQLRDYAKSHGSNWYDLNTQLAFMIGPDSGAPVVKDMVAHEQSSPSAAADYFHNKWEISADTSLDKREAKASQWFGQMSGWKADKELADSLLEQTGTTIDASNNAAVQTAQKSCSKTDDDTASLAGLVGLSQGGMTLEQAQAFMADYKQNGEAFLDARYPGGAGPGDCGHGKADNCVGFSTYFVNKFTSIQGFPPGNGIKTASSVASLAHESLTKTPSVYAVFSTLGSGPAGHTGVILGIHGDQVIIGEAACGTNHAGTRAYQRSLDSITNKDHWDFASTQGILTDQNIAGGAAS